MVQNYLESKCKGIYRLKTPVDPKTNNFYREKIWDDKHTKWEWGEYIRSEIYIMCDRGSIYHIGGNILEAYVSNIKNNRPYTTMVKKLKDVILSEMQIDSQIGGSFRFKYSDLDRVALQMGAYVKGADIKPLDSRNLLKDEYEIPTIDMNAFTKAKKKNKIMFNHCANLYNDFMQTKGLSSVEYLEKQRLEKISALEYIHKFYEWREFISYTKSWVVH